MKNFTNYTVYDKKENLSDETKVVRGALGHDPVTGAISFPIFQSSTYRHIGIKENTNFNYSRIINPTREEFERTMAMLDHGYRAFAVSSGMAATSLVLTMLKPKEHILISDDVYGGTVRACDEVLKYNGVEYSQIDFTDLENVKKSIRPNTKMMFIETPTNPMMKVADIASICEFAHSKSITVVVDNTFLTSYFQKPLDLGADLVVYSATKYIGGHNDILAGVVVVKTKEQADYLNLQMAIYGACLAPMESWLALRGLKTLAVRMDRHSSNAKEIAEFLRNHPKVNKVYYAGFKDHPQYEISLKQSTGFGGMISFELDSMETVNKFLERINLILFAESLGGVESLVTHPASRTHTEVSKETKEKLGITDTLLRLSVGIENVEDLINDIKQALE
ncbi:MAG: PLP-dependent transferase [Firmicutes bacterium]|nr:PLP-dependent transferase [Bacillota bacterium]